MKIWCLFFSVSRELRLIITLATALSSSLGTFPALNSPSCGRYANRIPLSNSKRHRTINRRNNITYYCFLCYDKIDKFNFVLLSNINSTVNRVTKRSWFTSKHALTKNFKRFIYYLFFHPNVYIVFIVYLVLIAFKIQSYFYTRRTNDNCAARAEQERRRSRRPNTKTENVHITIYYCFFKLGC